MKIENLTSLLGKLGKLAADSKAKDDGAVITGFSQNYGVIVHEDQEAHHEHGQAKFLEQPARQLTSDGTISGIVAKTVKAGHGVVKGLVMGGLRIQREAQLLVPLDTGALKASAFTAIEPDAPAAAQQAHEEGERIREAAMKKRESA